MGINFLSVKKLQKPLGNYDFPQTPWNVFQVDYIDMKKWLGWVIFFVGCAYEVLRHVHLTDYIEKIICRILPDPQTLFKWDYIDMKKWLGWVIFLWVAHTKYCDTFTWLIIWIKLYVAFSQTLKTPLIRLILIKTKSRIGSCKTSLTGLFITKII